MAAAAAYLGLTQSDLRTHLHSGQSLADVAAAQGKSVSGLADAVMAAMTTNSDANTTLTAEEKAVHLALMKSHLDSNTTPNRPIRICPAQSPSPRDCVPIICGSPA